MDQNIKKAPPINLMIKDKTGVKQRKKTRKTKQERKAHLKVEKAY